MRKIILAFSNNLITKGLELLLQREKGLTITAELNPSELNTRIIRERPDIAIVDFYVLINYVPDSIERTKIILLDTGCGDENINFAFVSRGISGLMKMDAQESDLMKAIDHVMEGLLWIDRKSAKNLLSIMTELAKIYDMTDREKEIFCMLGRGMDDVLISKELNINKRTVRLHINRVKTKIGNGTRWGLNRLSLQLGECMSREKQVQV